MPQFRSDEILWYNVGVWGRLGYACPNFGQDPTTLNETINYLTQVVGRNLFAIMQHSDADLRVPPSINTLTRVHKLITRARAILAGRALAPATPRMEPTHSTPAPQPFLVYPCPYWRVRSPWLKEWCGLILYSLGEAMQHTENRVEYEISTAFAGTVGQFYQRIYVRMAVELFGVDSKVASDPTFTLSDDQLKSYDPSKFFTSTELIDVVPAFTDLPTEEDMRVLSDGIPASQLLNLSSYPSSGPAPIAANGQPAQTVDGSAGVASATAAASAAAPASAPAFVPPPSP